jgi:hypothetical protein
MTNKPTTYRQDPATVWHGILKYYGKGLGLLPKPPKTVLTRTQAVMALIERKARVCGCSGSDIAIGQATALILLRHKESGFRAMQEGLAMACKIMDRRVGS